MLKRLLTLQELSLELSSDMDTYSRLLDSIDATNEFKSEVISTESSSPFLRAIGFKNTTKVDKFKLISHLDNILYTVAQDTYRKQSHFNDQIKDTVSFLKDHYREMSNGVDARYNVIYSPDMYSQQTMVVDNKLLNKEEFFKNVISFIDTFEILTVTHVEHIINKASNNLYKADLGSGVFITRDIKNNIKIPNNTTVSYKRKNNDTIEWKAEYKRSYIKKDIQMRITPEDIKEIYFLIGKCIEVLDKSTKHNHLDYRTGESKDKNTFNTVHKMYANLYLAMIRVVFVLTEMYSTFEDTVENNDVK